MKRFHLVWALALLVFLLVAGGGCGDDNAPEGWHEVEFSNLTMYAPATAQTKTWEEAKGQAAVMEMHQPGSWLLVFVCSAQTFTPEGFQKKVLQASANSQTLRIGPLQAYWHEEETPKSRNYFMLLPSGRILYVSAFEGDQGQPPLEEVVQVAEKVIATVRTGS